MQPLNENKTAAEQTKTDKPLVNESYANGLIEKVKFNLNR